MRKQSDIFFALALAVVFLLGCRKGGPKENSNVPPLVKTKTGIEMVFIVGGWLDMGSDEEGELDESPHKVYVSSFYMDRYEVTQKEYEKVVGKNPSRWKGKENPVEQIRWAKAVEYCNARSRSDGLQPAYDLKTWGCDFEASGYRLPTEAEWEYAARGGKKTRYFFGDSSSKLRLYAWFKDNCSRSPRPVGQKRPNPWGLYDIYGNVWEWCNDFYKEDYYRESPEANPKGPKAGKTKVLRGGCWNSPPDKCRSSYRENEDPGYTDVCFGRDVHGFCGFRCVRSYNAP